MYSDGPRVQSRGGRGGARAKAPLFAALDLGTNNCRMLIAAPDAERGVRVVDGYSRIVRLGEGLSQAGRLSDAAMARAYQALTACAQRIEARAPVAIGCVATQACRTATNGKTFLHRIRQDLGLDFQIIDAQEESRLAVLGCASLLEPEPDVTMIVDIGGGSTELSWVRPRDVLSQGTIAPVLAWGSAPLGVVTLADEEDEPETDKQGWYESLVHRLAAAIAPVGAADHLRAAFEAGRAQVIGTSGTVTSLAGVHLELPRYQRTRVDGYWFEVADCRAAIVKILRQNLAQRAANPCIGPDRADLVVLGGAILDAVLRVWPASRIRVADRGLREGMLMRLMAEHGVGG